MLARPVAGALAPNFLMWVVESYISLRIRFGTSVASAGSRARSALSPGELEAAGGAQRCKIAAPCMLISLAHAVGQDLAEVAHRHLRCSGRPSACLIA